jgi:hypothetical protein
MQPESHCHLSKSHPVLRFLHHMYPAHIYLPQLLYFLILSYPYFHVLLYPSGIQTETSIYCHVLVTRQGI